MEAERKAHTTEEEETVSERIRKCAELRHERIQRLSKIMGYNEALARQDEELSDYELKCQFEGALHMTPELRYQRRKDNWLHHESCWFMRRFTTIPPLTEYDGYGCTADGCIPSCRYYAPSGRIENDEIIQLEEEELKREKELRAAEYRMLGFKPDDSDDTKRKRWEEIHDLESRILHEKLEYMHQTQHIGPSQERLKAIENDAWAEFYKSKNKNTEQQQQSQ